MAQYINKSALVAEIKRHISIAESQLALFGNEDEKNRIMWAQQKKVCEIILSFLDTIEVKEVYVSNPQFPHLKDIIDKVFGAGNLEFWEYDDAEQLVLLTKEELLKDLEVKEVDLEKEYKDFIKSDNGRSMFEIAKHFFELGARVNNPITAADRGTAEEIIINLKRIEQDYRINLTKEIEWVRNTVKKGE